MFGDIGFWELVVIAVVALLVIGPERLPGVARKAGLWIGKGRRFLQTVKEDIDRELAADELRRILKEQSDSAGVHEIIEEAKGALEQTKDELKQTKNELHKATDELREAGAEQEYLVSAVNENKEAPAAVEHAQKEPSGHDEAK
jgi:sec-independent protein translocase protein TatB